MKQQFFGMLEELFELGSGSLTGDERLQGLPEWSSLTFVALIAMVDEEYEVTLAPKEVLECETVKDLAELVDRESTKRQAA